MDCNTCGRRVSSDWRGSKCPYCGATLMDVATAALALVFGAALMWVR